MRKLRRTLPSLNCLYVVEAVFRHLSFTKAAEELGISQPAVSKSIRQVEQALGVRLFVRQHRGLLPTSEGAIFSDQIQVSMDGIDKTVRNLVAKSGGQEIKINVSSSFMSMWLVRRITRYKEQHPDVRLEISENQGDLDPQTLSAIDFSTRIGVGNWNDVRAWPLSRERLLALASPEYLKKHPQCRHLETLQQANLLHATEIKRSRMGWNQWFKAVGIPYSSAPDVLFSDHHSAIQAALTGQGVTLGWQHLVGDHLREGSLVHVTGAAVETEQHVYLVSPRSRTLSHHHEMFRDWVIEQFEQDETLPSDICLFPSPARLGD